VFFPSFLMIAPTIFELGVYLTSQMCVLRAFQADLFKSLVKAR